VPRDASDETIRTAFRKAAKACHPDLNAGDPAAQHQFRQLIDAYEMLKTPQQRAVYDDYLAAYDRHRRRARVRRFTDPAIAGLVSGGVIALAVWLFFSLSNRQEASGQPQTPRIAAATVGEPASEQVAASDDNGGRQDGDSGHERDWAAAAPN